MLVEKLADGNVRVRDAARAGLEVLAGSSNIGPAVVAALALKPLPNDKKSAWRPIVGMMINVIWFLFCLLFFAI